MGAVREQLRFVPLGVGDAFSQVHYSTSLAVLFGDDVLLLDCPHPIRKMLRDAAESTGLPLCLEQVVAVAVSHLHADHASGIETVGFYNHFILGRRAHLAAHPVVAERIWNGNLAGSMGQFLNYDTGELSPRTLGDWYALTPVDDGQPVQLGPFTLETRRTVHNPPTTAFRVSAGGRSLAYSADTAFDAGLVDWLSAADLVIHETGLGIHTDYAQLAALPADVRERMRLIHYPDGFQPPEGGIELLVEGRAYDV